MTGIKSNEEWEWKVKDAANVLMRSQEIYADKKLLKAARAELIKRRAAIAVTLGKSPGAAVKGK